VHGRNNYRRVAVVILYSLYKQMAFVTSLFLYNIVNGWFAPPHASPTQHDFSGGRRGLRRRRTAGARGEARVWARAWGRSGTAVYDSWIMAGFNALYTFLPPIAYGFMEQDVECVPAPRAPPPRASWGRQRMLDRDTECGGGLD
jgi:magnesium-transporting ATPase (P-type)